MSLRAAVRAAVAAAFLMAFAAPSFAAAIRWNNPAGGNWNVAANWSPATVPTASDTAVLDLAGTYTVTVNVNPTVAGLRITGAASGTQTLAAVSRTLAFSGPVTIGAQGVADWTSCTVNGAGAIANEGALTLTNSTVAQALSNAGTLATIGTCALSGALTTTSSSLLRVLANASFNTVLTSASGFTNNGTIELTSSGAATSATLNVTAGTLVNATGATIGSLVGGGGARNLNAALANGGTITVAQPLTVNKASVAHTNAGTIDLTTGNLTVVISGTTPSFTTTGTIHVPTGRTLTLQGGVVGGANQNFRYNGGTLGGAGTVQLLNAALVLDQPLSTVATNLTGNASQVNGPSTLTVATGTTMTMTNGSAVNAPTVVQTASTLQFTTSDLIGATTTSGVLEFISTCNMSGALTTTSSSLLRVLANASFNTVLTSASGFTNNGTIELVSSGAPTSATLNVTAGTLVNTTGATIGSLVGGGGARNLNAALGNSGTITVEQALTVNKASVAHTNQGVIDLTTGNLTIVISGTTPSFTTSNSVFVGAGRTLTLQGGVVGGANQNFRYNGGTLGGAGTVQLLNAALVLDQSLPSSMARVTGNASQINGPGTFTVSTGTTVTMTNGSAVNATTVIESASTLQLTNSDQLGTVTNGGVLEWIGTCAWSGSITTQPGSIVRVLANASFNTVVTAANGFTNSANVELLASGAPTSATLNVTAGTLVNAPTGVIASLVASGGARNLNARLDNQGTITVDQALTTNKASVAHVNSGTIDLTTGNYTIVISGTTPSFTTTGTINVPTGRTLTLQGGVVGGANQNFRYNGGTLGGAGTVQLLNAALVLDQSLPSSMARVTGNASQVNGPGTFTVSVGTTVTMTNGSAVNAATVIEPASTLQLTNSDHLGTVTNGGVLEWIGTCAWSGSITTQLGSIVRVLANASFNTVVTAANGFANSANVELLASGAPTSATLNVTAGTLVNAPTGVIASLVASGGARNLNARLDNQGTITVAQALTTNKASVAHVNSGTIDLTGGNYTIVISGTTPSFTTTGTINVPTGRTLTLQGGVVGGANQNFRYNGGTLGGAGTVQLLNAALVLDQPLSTVATNLTGNASQVNGPSTLTVATGTTMTMTNGSAVNAPTVVQTASTLQFTTSDLIGATNTSGVLEFISTCNMSGALTTTSSSLLRVLANASFNTVLTSANGFTNNGTIELVSSGAPTSATLNVTAGTLTNAVGATIGSLVGGGGARNLNAALANGGTITVAQPLTVNKASVAHTNAGTIDLTTGNLTVVISGTTPSFTTTGTIHVPAGRTLTLQGGVVGGANQNFRYNGGTLGGAGTVQLLNAALVLDQPLSTVTTNLAGNASQINGPGAFTVGPATTLAMTNGSVVNATTTVDTTATQRMTNSDQAGAITNGGLVEWIGTCTLSGALTSLPTSAMRVLANASFNSVLTSPIGVTNHGTLELTSTGAATAATMNVTTGALTNATDGRLLVLFGGGGARTLGAALVNSGLADFQQTTTLLKAAAAHANDGTLAVSSGRTLTVTGASLTNAVAGVIRGSGTLTLTAGTSFTQAGTVRPGASPGVLTFNTGLPSQATSVFDVEVGGDDPGTGYDRLVVRDPATLAGTLNVSVVNGYLPVPGRRYVIATFPSRTGTFATVNGLDYGPGQMWTVAYSDTDVVLLAMDQTWSRILPDGGLPAPRDGHAAVYDSTGDRMIVFGGLTDSGPRNDVWVLTHATSGNYPTWIALSPTGTPPAARTNASAAYDPATNRMIVHGGDDGAATPTPFGDTWVLTNANGLGGTPAWIALATVNAPAARSAHAAAYDPATNRLMVVGGDTAPGTCGGEEAIGFLLENANGLGGSPLWTPFGYLTPAAPARAFAGAAWDAASQRLILTGGDSCGVARLDTWVVDGANVPGGATTWTALAPVANPPAGWSLARYAYDPTLQWMDGFGGRFGGVPVDTSFTLTNASGGGTSSWHRRLFYGTRPPARALHSMVLASAPHTAVVFGGSGASGRLNDLWRRELNLGRVLDADPPAVAAPVRTAFARLPSPNPARGAVAMAVDVARDQRIELGVYDVSGRRVATLHDGPLVAGRHAFTWGSGRGVAPGVYLVRLRSDEREQVVRVVRLK